LRPTSLFAVLALILLLALPSAALARVEFAMMPVSASAFRGYDQLSRGCDGEAPSFWCRYLTDELTLITGKSNDYIFDEAGQLLAVFTKPQKGQDYVGRDGTYRLGFDHNDNLIPVRSSVPGGAVMVDGEYEPPENVTGVWERQLEGDVPYYLGTFSYQQGGVQIEKTVRVSSIDHIVAVSLQAERLEAADGETLLQYVVPGIARTEQPVVKIGQGESYSANPISQPVMNPRYISLQNNNRNTANALILRPNAALGGADSAQFYPPNLAALQSALAPEAGAAAELGLDLYAGPNELVRYEQEGFMDLPGLFRPNILGWVSLGVLWTLQQIHAVIPDWGLSIIVLTLLFRVLIWPLITTQTKSMYGMQRLQPKLQALQKKHKDDREKLTQETMKLYREAGVNPAGGCLPIILQMPLFIILWRIFANFEFNAGFLWIPDLGQPDPFYILPVLYVGVILAQSWFMAQGNKQMMRQQMILNVVFVFFFLTFPAGVILYYVVSMLVQVFQYWLIQRQHPNPAAAT
jgi:YidC/Oxa1 family membrane protein insertase